MESSELNSLSLDPSALRYLRVLDIGDIEKLKGQDALELYERLCRKTETRQNQDVIEMFAEAIAKAQESRILS